MKTPDFSELEGAYLVREDPELEKRVSDSLDAIAAQGERGTKALVERLYKDMTLKGNTLIVKDYGDYSWNEWLKRRMIVEALGRAKATSTADALTPLVSARCAEGQFREILQPAVARVLAEMKGFKSGTAPTQQGLTAKEWNDKGDTLAQLDRYQEAIPCFDKALAIDPRNVDAWYNKGIMLGKSGHPQEAIQCFDKALAIDPKDADAWTNKGVALNKSGRHQEAIPCCDKALEIDLQYAMAWYNKGAALYELNRYQEALQCFDKALAIDPKNAMALAFKGALAKRELRRNQEALPYCDKALAIDPKNKAAQYLNSMSASK